MWALDQLWGNEAHEPPYSNRHRSRPQRSSITKSSTPPLITRTNLTALNYYLEGGTNNDFATLEKAFHPTATMRFMGGEGDTDVNAVDYFRKGMKSGPKQDRITRVISVNIAGNAASAQLEIEYLAFFFIDFMHLLKIEEKWSK